MMLSFARSSVLRAKSSLRKSGVLTAALVAALVTMGVPSQTAVALEVGKPSVTAVRVALLRALAARAPDPAIRGRDYFAEAFLTQDLREVDPKVAFLERSLDDALANLGSPDLTTYYFVKSRTAHMDVQLRAALDSGAEQLVVLGAGFDSRAYRLNTAYPHIQFVEVDYPPTQRWKVERVKDVLYTQPPQVLYVPVNFETDSLAERLESQGVDFSKRTYFIWEGVTMYLDEAGVVGTLDVVRQFAPGSIVIFDYVRSSILTGKDDDTECLAAYNLVKNLNEPFMFGIDWGETAAFAEKSGFTLRSDVDHDYMNRKFLTASDGKLEGKTYECFKIAEFEVPG